MSINKDEKGNQIIEWGWFNSDLCSFGNLGFINHHIKDCISSILIELEL